MRDDRALRWELRLRRFLTMLELCKPPSEIANAVGGHRIMQSLLSEAHGRGLTGYPVRMIYLYDRIMARRGNR